MNKQPINYLDLEIEDNNPQWMKLVDYVNQREEETYHVPSYFTYEHRFDDIHMFSKRMGFVKWLVENDKIDTQNLITYMNGTSLTFNKVPSTDCVSIDKIWNKFYIEVLLMLLSIEDNPTTFMLSILK